MVLSESGFLASSSAIRRRMRALMAGIARAASSVGTATRMISHPACSSRRICCAVASTFSVTVPEGYLWLMGDNRAHSKDSRYHQEATGNGFVPVGNVTGKVWAIFYPFSHFGTLPDGNAPFSDVP